MDLDQLAIEVGRCVPLFFKGSFSFYWRHSNLKISRTQTKFFTFRSAGLSLVITG